MKVEMTGAASAKIISKIDNLFLYCVLNKFKGWYVNINVLSKSLILRWLISRQVIIIIIIIICTVRKCISIFKKKKLSGVLKRPVKVGQEIFFIYFFFIIVEMKNECIVQSVQ